MVYWTISPTFQHNKSLDFVIFNFFCVWWNRPLRCYHSYNYIATLHMHSFRVFSYVIRFHFKFRKTYDVLLWFFLNDFCVFKRVGCNRAQELHAVMSSVELFCSCSEIFLLIKDSIIWSMMFSFVCQLYRLHPLLRHSSQRYDFSVVKW